jgi:hypothetical protein
MPAGGVSPTGNPRHETGFEPPAGQRQPKLLNHPREALRSRHPALRDRRNEQSYGCLCGSNARDESVLGNQIT